MRRNDIVSRLLLIDEEVELTLGVLSPKPRVVIVGGAAFLLLEATSRAVTHDVDVYMADASVREIIARYPELNGSVSAYADHIPYNYEDRLRKLDIGARAVEYLVPSPEDLAVMKLYADRPADRLDVESAVRSGAVDMGRLDALVRGDNEARASALSARRYDEMLWAYERLRERLEDEPDL